MNFFNPTRLISGQLLLLLCLVIPQGLSAAELIRGLGGVADFGVLAMGRNDDGSSARISLGSGFPQGINFFGNTYTTLYINNNGNITFNAPVGGFTPVSFPVSAQPMMAPYWGDVDTRGSTADSTWNNVYYSTTLPGKFIVTWYNVGYYNSHTNKLNNFQLILTERSNVSPGDFDVEFRYERLEWTTGDASGGSNGLGGVPAQVGFDAGDRVHYYKHPASMTASILELINTSNVDAAGVWRFQVRSGVITAPTTALSNVEVILKLPSNRVEIDNSSFVTAPQSIATVGEELWVTWKFDRFSAEQIADLSFEVLAKDPVAGENHLISSVLELRYKDINGNPVYNELDARYVAVLPSLYQLGLTTAKPVYEANETVALNGLIENLSDFNQTAYLSLALQDDMGNKVAELPLIPVAVKAHQTFTVTENFQTHQYYAGNYQVYAELRDGTGQVLTSTQVPFQLTTTALPQVSAQTQSDKPSYLPNEPIQLQHRIYNQTVNVLLSDLHTVTEIYAPEGQLCWSTTQPLVQLLPNSMVEQHQLVPTGGATAGPYHVILKVQDANGHLQARADTYLQIRSTAETGIGLQGALHLPAPTVRKTESFAFAGEWTNHGNSATNGLPLFLAIVDPANEQLLQEWQEPATLQVQETYTRQQAWPALVAAGKTVVIIMGYYRAGERVVLASETVSIQDKVQVDFKVGSRGKLLILVDAGEAEPDGKPTAPKLRVQKLFLANLLETHQWEYRIVNQVEDFSKALRSDNYSVYAILSEQEKLSESTQKELRAAVYRGAGLLVAGAHDQRLHLSEALGIKYQGRYSKATGINLNLPTLTGPSLFLVSEKPLRADLQGATSLATFLTTTNPAMTTYQYGLGKSCYAGFDWLSQATQAGTESLFAKSLITALSMIHPATLNVRAGGYVPLSLQLTNVGTSVPAKISLSLPPGVQAMPEQWQLTLTDHLTLTSWLQLPWELSNVEIIAHLWLTDYPYADYPLMLTVPPTSNPTQLLTLLETAPPAVRNHLQQAVAMLQAGQEEQALQHLLQGIDTLPREAQAWRLALAWFSRDIALVLSHTSN
jgi:hypothetical protein